MERFSRTELLIGADGLGKLKKATVAIFGVGGVGGYVVEALARSGIGSLALIDPDKVSVSNINRQIIALSSTVGQYKTHAAKARAEDINPACRVETYEIFYLPDNEDIDFFKPSDLSFMGRTGTDRENANLILFLASDEASYISGQNIQIDGCRKKM